MASDKLGIHILGPTFFGTRQVGLRIDKKINTPADLAGVNLRMPGGDAWQFLGRAIGANPTAMAVTEVYTALQTGSIDGQDNPLPNVKTLKFNEVMKQIVLTGHVVGYDLLTISNTAWESLTPEQQKKLQEEADKAMTWSAQQHLDQESTLVEEFKGQGLDIYTPDVAAFRTHAQKMYLESDFSKSWPAGALERIGAL
jgi:TRAP-type C4-dicarboxylate transport system substrate-binding protein